MPLRLHESTQVRLSAKAVKALAAMSEEDRRYFAQKFQHPQLLDAQSIIGAPASLHLIRLQFRGTRRAVARHISNCLLIIAIGTDKKKLERFGTYRGCQVGINECVPLGQTPLAPFLVDHAEDFDLERVKKDIAEGILARVREEFAAQEALTEVCQTVDVLCACQDEQAAKTNLDIATLKAALEALQITKELGQPSQSKGLVVRETLAGAWRSVLGWCEWDLLLRRRGVSNRKSRRSARTSQ